MSGIDMGFYRIILGTADTRNELYGWDEIRIGATPWDVLPNAVGKAFDGLLLLVR
jgi:hypothetical protein